jgi:hypothetical protein
MKVNYGWRTLTVGIEATGNGNIFFDWNEMVACVRWSLSELPSGKKDKRKNLRLV